MAYVPDPTNVNEPDDTIIAETAAAEFRALKAYIKAIVAPTLTNPYRRNLIIGGQFNSNPWQRGTSIGVTSHQSLYTADCWLSTGNIASGILTISQALDAPTSIQSGRTIFNSLKAAVTTPAVPVNNHYGITYAIEGYDFAAFYPNPVTLSFWHKHSIPGNYYISFRDSTSTQTYVGKYTQVGAGTWEFATISVLVFPSAGNWVFNNGLGLNITFTIAAQGTYTTPNGIWTAGEFYSDVDQINVLGTNGASFQIADPQLELGSQFTNFQPYSEADTVNFCLRRFEVGTGLYSGSVTNTDSYTVLNSFKVPKRTTNPAIVGTDGGISNGFAAVVGTIATGSTSFFTETRVSNGTQAAGAFSTNWTASSDF
jgi:hypothetical protein